MVFFFISNACAQSNWSPWRQTDCLKGLDFRVKRGEYNEFAKKYHWDVEFRNRYNDNIHFNCIAVEPSRKSEIRSSERTSDRLHADANGGTNTAWFLINSSSEIYVHVNRIRISDKDSGEDYYDCDN